MRRLFIKQFLLVIVTLCCSVTAWGQVTFESSAPSLVSLGEAFQVQFTVNGTPENHSFKAPKFEGFNIIAGPSTATGYQMEWINGKQTSNYTVTYTYSLVATDAGIKTIGSASVRVEGKQYTTKPLKLEVVQERRTDKGSSSSRGGINEDNIFIDYKISSKNVYKGEPVRVSLVLYLHDVLFRGINYYDIPSFDNFWRQELKTNDRESREVFDGLIYDTYKIIEYIVVPQRDGSLTISPSKVQVSLLVEDDNNYFLGPQYRPINVILNSKEHTINVKDFPAGAPASFNGAVGNMKMSAVLPKGDIDIHTAQQIEVTISGEGNLQFITAPKITLPDSFEVFDTKVTNNITTNTYGTNGSVTYTYPFVARAGGHFDIAPIEFTYFDTKQHKYVTLTSEGSTIVVQEGSTTASAPTIGGGFGTMKQLDKDIRHIHTNKLPRKAASMLIFSPIYWLIVVSIVALFIVIFIVMRRRMRQNGNLVARRMKRADKVAVQRLRLAQKYMNEGYRHSFYEELLKALWGYISDKFNIPVSNLTKETIREELYRRNCSSEDIEQFCLIISRADEAQYAPSSEGDMNEIYDDAIDIISRIESAVK